MRRGKRSRAGRPRGTKVQHVARVAFRASVPQHVTFRFVADLGSMRRDKTVRIVRDAIRACHKPAFRVVHFSVLSNHMHLITEAANAEALARGLQGLAVRVARRTNAALERAGALFADRYHARPLKTPREVRVCLAYVLLNQRHHVTERVLDRAWVDPCSSGTWFDGWRRPLGLGAPWQRELAQMTPPVAEPTVWLLTTGWRRHGLLAFGERPGPTDAGPSQVLRT